MALNQAQDAGMGLPCALWSPLRRLLLNASFRCSFIFTWLTASLLLHLYDTGCDWKPKLTSPIVL